MGCSPNLSREIAERIRIKGAKIIIEELIGPTNSFYNTADQWLSKNNAPNIIIYVGVSHHGLLLIDQISEKEISVPIIFTDGCMIASLLTYVEKLSGKAFIVSPVVLKEENRLKPTYKPIGEDAYTLICKIISECKNCTRKEVRDYITNNKKKIIIEQGLAGNYAFNDEWTAPHELET